MNKNALYLMLLTAGLVAIAISPILFWESSESQLTFELPREYRVYSFCQAEGNESVKITTILGCNNRNIPIKGGEIEVGIFPSSDSDAEFIIRDESGDGYWIIFTALIDGRREVDITWWSDNIRPDQTITLPTGEAVTFLGFDSCEGNPPRFSVVVES